MGKSRGMIMAKKRKVNMKAIKAAIASPKTPKHLKEGLKKKYHL
jgi:hypothetical protein